MEKYPKPKKNIKTFLKSEDGFISKKSIIKLGIISAGFVGIISDIKEIRALEEGESYTTCDSTWNFKYDDAQDYARHSQHSSHVSY